MRHRAGRAALLVLAAGLVWLLSSVAAGDPSIGTTVDLDRSNAVAGQIMGENHAKPLPRHQATDAMSWTILGILTAGALLPLLQPPWRRVEPPRPSGADPSALGWWRLALRGPPLPG